MEDHITDRRLARANMKILVGRRSLIECVTNTYRRCPIRQRRGLPSPLGMRVRPLPAPILDASSLAPALPPPAFFDDSAPLADSFPRIGIFDPVRRCNEAINVSCACVIGVCKSLYLTSCANAGFSDHAMNYELEKEIVCKRRRKKMSDCEATRDGGRT